MDSTTPIIANELSPMDILLVEDNPGDIRLLEEALKDENFRYELNIVDDGTDLLNYLNTHFEQEKLHYPDLIILDLNLPKKDGFECLEEIRNDEKLDKIRIIVFTTSNLLENKLKCYDMGAYAYVTKPADFEGYKDITKLLKRFQGSFYKN